MAMSEWDNSCRLCTEERAEMFSIFGDEGLRRKIPHKLRVCLPVMVYKTDPLPKKICQFCAARLDDVYEFREYCLSVYKSMHAKLLRLRDSKTVQIYMDAMNNSPDPCQVRLCKEKSRAPPPLMPLPAVLHLPQSVNQVKVPKLIPAQNIGIDILPELPCEVQIKEDPSDLLVRSDFPENPKNRRSSSRRVSREAKIEEKNENDVIILDDSLTEEESIQAEIAIKEEKRTSILEQALKGNLAVGECTEVTPKTKLTSEWWCSPCNSYFRTKSSLMKHMQLFCPRTYSCSKCSLVCHTVEELAKHEATNHLKVTLDFDETLKECHQCDREFVSWEMLRHHRLRDHVAGSMKIGTNTWCPICNRFFPTVESYHSHKQLHDNGKYVDENTTIRAKSAPKLRENDSKREHFIESVKSLTCPTCGKVCTQQSALSNHMRTHEPKKHKCEICGRCFGLFIRLAAHRLNEHGQQPIMSPITASVEQEEALNAEREAREARESLVRRPPMTQTFAEFIDDDEISMEDQLNNKHDDSHDANSSKNVARCGICQQWFNDHTTMLTHLQTHSDNLTTKSFSCKVCKKAFKEKWQMIRHEVCHNKNKVTSHPCKMCKKTFTNQHELEAHQTTHKVNKTYHCPKCNKIFFKEFSLKTHQCTAVAVSRKRNSSADKKSRKTFNDSVVGSPKKRKNSNDNGNKLKNSNSKVREKKRGKNPKNDNSAKLGNKTMPKLSPESFGGTSIPALEPNNIEANEVEPLAMPVKRTLIRTAGGYRCGVCQSPFVLRDLAVAHLRSAHPMMPYQCPYCKQRFTTQYTFSHHIKTDHLDESEK